MRKTVLMTIASVLVLVAVLIVGFLVLNRPQLVVVGRELPPEFADDGFSHAPFEALLKHYVDAEGRVNYQRWHDDPGDRVRLEQYLAAVARFSPDNTPERFVDRNSALAYWIYAYNAYVIHSVLLHWPLESVVAVRAPIEAVTGLGFFYRQRFLFGGVPYSLYVVEHKKILAEFTDPRIHFVLNCASESCPVLRPELPSGAALEPALVSATTEFINDRRNVRVNDEDRTIVLSTIFKWYKKDFVNDLARRGIPSHRGVLDYISLSASIDLRNELQRAENYEVVFDDYDWAINGASDGPSPAH